MRTLLAIFRLDIDTQAISRRFMVVKRPGIRHKVTGHPGGEQIGRFWERVFPGNP